MSDDFLDIASATPDQKFALMLLERIERLEKDLTRLTPEPPMESCPEYDDFRARLYDAICPPKRPDEHRVKMARLVPENIFALLSDPEILGIHDAVVDLVENKMSLAMFPLLSLSMSRTRLRHPGAVAWLECLASERIVSLSQSQ